jgi:ParB family chromosome partitioning protein
MALEKRVGLKSVKNNQETKAIQDRNNIESAFFDTNTIHTTNMTGDNQIVNIPIKDIFPSSYNKFKKYSEQKESEMIESIKEFGVLEPTLVRPLPEQIGKFELISGENRWRISKIAGKDTVPAIVKNIDRDTAIIMLNDVNLNHRENLSLYEKCQAYNQCYDAMKRKSGERTDLKGEEAIRTTEILGQKYGLSARTMASRIKLARLIEQGTNMIENKKLPLASGEILTALSKDNQVIVFDYIQDKPGKLNKEQANTIVQHAELHPLSPTIIEQILQQDSKKTPKITSLSTKNFIRFFHSNTDIKEMEDTIEKALELYFSQHKIPFIVDNSDESDEFFTSETIE